MSQSFDFEFSSVVGSGIPIPLTDPKRLIIRNGDGFFVGQVITLNMPSFGIGGRWLVEEWDAGTRVAKLRLVAEAE